MEKTMSNNTTNETSGNETALESNNTMLNGTVNDISESGMLDALLDSPELLLMGLIMAAMAAYIAYTQPAVRAMLMPLLKKYDSDISTLMDKHMSAAQMKAYEKLDELAQKHVKDAMLKNVIMSVYDENDDKFVAVIKGEVKDALVKAKQL